MLIRPTPRWVRVTRSDRLVMVIYHQIRLGSADFGGFCLSWSRGHSSSDCDTQPWACLCVVSRRISARRVQHPFYRHQAWCYHGTPRRPTEAWHPQRLQRPTRLPPRLPPRLPTLWPRPSLATTLVLAALASEPVTRKPPVNLPHRTTALNPHRTVARPPTTKPSPPSVRSPRQPHFADFSITTHAANLSLLGDLLNLPGATRHNQPHHGTTITSLLSAYGHGRGRARNGC
ncbi:uncharacterized protein CANTADRAFT_229361 [Suhomyces tanzawaensis NRRL Y-17324]|uniref:Uncharacterized protein n=1 Tax=Suhomyces tanzawaensis NRRL Y-17324 TaxID=984487 RepID=A0A1E4SKZ9_9ASCO|nr:uncharacterized protein CANTADRAFT_229361 [Suhomyces tanzawaensis NRRL Y-17324]ODV80195.1 hypothetical protein CANTADRAFT_229361 [Suhomyces tanzawaensis NRRL Y-17324]